MIPCSNMAAGGGRRRRDSPDWELPSKHGWRRRKRSSRRSSWWSSTRRRWPETTANGAGGEARVRVRSPEKRRERGSKVKEEREMRTSPWGLIPTARAQAGRQSGGGRDDSDVVLLAGEEGGKEKKGICPENPLGFSVFRETLKQQLLAFF